jgi:hypothetical protein
MNGLFLATSSVSVHGMACGGVGDRHIFIETTTRLSTTLPCASAVAAVVVWTVLCNAFQHT